MVGTIGFAGSKARERGKLWRWTARVALTHLWGSAIGGAVLGVSAAFVGLIISPLTDDLSAGTLIFLLAALALADLVGLPAKYLSRARQVPLSWKHVFPAPMSAALYGVALGMGVGTTIYWWSFFALISGLVVLGNPLLGAAVGLAFGLVSRN